MVRICFGTRQEVHGVTETKEFASRARNRGISLCNLRAAWKGIDFMHPLIAGICLVMIGIAVILSGAPGFTSGWHLVLIFCLVATAVAIGWFFLKSKPDVKTETRGNNLEELRAIVSSPGSSSEQKDQARAEIQIRIHQVLGQIDEYLRVARTAEEKKVVLYYAQQAHALAYSLQEKFPHIFGGAGQTTPEWSAVFGVETPVGGIIVGAEPKVSSCESPVLHDELWQSRTITITRHGLDSIS